MRSVLVFVIACASACASADKKSGPPAAAPVHPAREIVSGGGELRGGTIRMAVTIGGPLGPRGTAASAATTTQLHAAGAVKP